MENMNMLENISQELEGVADQLVCIVAGLTSKEGAPTKETLERALVSASSHIRRLAAVIDAKDAEIQEVKE